MAKKIRATTETSHQLLYKYTIAKIEKNKSLLTQQLLHLKRIGSMYCECPNKNRMQILAVHLANCEANLITCKVILKHM